MAISLDGTQAFVLSSTTNAGSTLYAVSLISLAVTATLPVQGQATGVAVGPNGLVYVSTVNQLLEINPASLTPTPSGAIALNASPSRAVFTPDGKYALLINRTPITGSSIIQVDLTSHQVVSTIPNFNTVLDSLFVAGNNSIYAYSSQTQSLIPINLPLAISNTNPGGISLNNVSAALSNEVAGTVTTAHYLYVLSGTTLYRIDLTSNQLAGQVTLPAAGAGALKIAGQANTGAAPATILQYGNNQVFTAGATSLPVVARVLDASGLPVSGALVTFAKLDQWRYGSESECGDHSEWFRANFDYGAEHKWLIYGDSHHRQRDHDELHIHGRN